MHSNFVVFVMPFMCFIIIYAGILLINSWGKKK